jgi:hypothetical protein
MFTRVLPATFAVLCVATVAVAADAALPAVETMTCDQMIAEMIVAGQRMNSQLDPEFAREAQAMADQMKSAGSAGSMMGGMGSAIACSLPGVGLICGVGAMMSTSAPSGEHMERMQAQMERLQKAMEGLDMARLEAMSTRFEAQKCQVPQDTAQTP